MKSFQNSKVSVSEPSICFVTRLFLSALYWLEGMIWLCGQESLGKIVKSSVFVFLAPASFSYGYFSTPWNNLPPNSSSVTRFPSLWLKSTLKGSASPHHELFQLRKQISFWNFGFHWVVGRALSGDSKAGEDKKNHTAKALFALSHPDNNYTGSIALWIILDRKNYPKPWKQIL